MTDLDARSSDATSPGGTLEQAWEAYGLTPALLERARNAGIADSYLQRMLSWNAPPKRFDEEVDWAERLLNGTIRFRQLTPADDDAFRTLWANSPEAIGDWDVTVERGPNAFAQFELQERPVLNGLFDGATMVACVSFSIRRTVVGGRDIMVHYGQAMRVHNEHRGRQYAHWVRSLPWAVGLGRPTHLQYDYIRGGNLTMGSWNRKFMPKVDTVPEREDDVPGLPVTVLQYPALAGAQTVPGVRPARVEDLPRCVDLINSTHAGRDLFLPYTLPSLMERLDAGLIEGMRTRERRPYSLDDLYVLERDAEIVACAGLWDRGRDVWERRRHRPTGEEHVIAVTSLLDYGFADSAPDTLAGLIEHLVAMTHGLGRDYLVAPIEAFPDVAALLASHDPVPETRYLQWRAERPPLTAPAYLDLVYW